MFFDEIETHPGVLNIDLDLSSNSIKFEGARCISASVRKLSDRYKKTNLENR